MNELALFSGAGGGLLGTRLLGWRPVCAVEISAYCREVLLRRQQDGMLPLFPIWDDIRTFDGREWAGHVDVVTGGFPCQPWSLAGPRRGATDTRNLWPDTLRVIREVGPRYCLLENVPGLKAKPYFGQILRDLAESGFRVRWDCIPASALGAPHRRDRLWILAYSPRTEFGHKPRRRPEPDGAAETIAGNDGPPSSVAHPDGPERRPEAEGRLLPYREEARWPEGTGGPGERGWWESEPDVGRVANGVAHRVDRLRALGNGQVPGVVRAAWSLGLI